MYNISGTSLYIIPLDISGTIQYNKVVIKRNERKSVNMNNYEKLLPVARILCQAKDPYKATQFLLQTLEQEMKENNKEAKQAHE